MKKSIYTLISLLCLVTSAMAQPGYGPLPGGRQGGTERGQGRGKERIHAAKIAYIVDRLKLTSTQAVAFTPVYNEMENEVKETRRSFKTMNKGDQNPENDEADSRKWIDDNLDYQQKIIEIKRKYNERYLKIMSANQLADLYKAQREFHQMLMQRLQDRGPRGGGGGRFKRG